MEEFHIKSVKRFPPGLRIRRTRNKVILLAENNMICINTSVMIDRPPPLTTDESPNTVLYINILT